VGALGENMSYYDNVFCQPPEYFEDNRYDLYTPTRTHLRDADYDLVNNRGERLEVIDEQVIYDEGAFWRKHIKTTSHTARRDHWHKKILKGDKYTVAVFRWIVDHDGTSHHERVYYVDGKRVWPRN
jgi:hypothetical protein